MIQSLMYLLFGLLITTSVCSRVEPLTTLSPKSQIIDPIFQNANLQKTTNKMTLQLSDRIVSLLSVPDVRQATLYTCGPSSLQAVLGYYQFDWRESDLAKIAKTTQQGTTPENMLAGIQGLGLQAEMRQYMTIQDLHAYIANNQPVIVLFQAWADPGTDYKNDWEDGHYAVVIGYDKDYLYFEDPSILGSVGYISKSQFMDRWHDTENYKKKYYKLGIVIKAPQKPHPVIIKLE